MYIVFANYGTRPLVHSVHCIMMDIHHAPQCHLKATVVWSNYNTLCTTTQREVHLFEHQSYLWEAKQAILHRKQSTRGEKGEGSFVLSVGSQRYQAGSGRSFHQQLLATRQRSKSITM